MPDMKLADGDGIVTALISDGQSEYFVTASNGQTLRFSDETLRAQGRVGQGVAAIALGKGASVVSASVLPAQQEGLVSLLVATDSALVKKVPISQYPQSLLTVEVLREGATIVMLVSIALLAVARARERWAVFLWTFALWDISYYAGLWATIRWPTSLKDPDVLFLIPVPWVAQVWFPLLVSALTLITVGLSRRQMQV